MLYQKKNKSIIYFSPHSNNNYSHCRFLFLTMSKIVKKEIYLLAPENFYSKVNLHHFFQLKKVMKFNVLNNNIFTKILKTVFFIYQSIYNTLVIYKVIKGINSKNIILLIEGYKPFDIFFISLFSNKNFKIRILYENFNFNFFLNLIQNISFYLMRKLNKNLQIIEHSNFLKKKSKIINGKIINQPLHSLFNTQKNKNIGNNILLPGSYRSEKGFNNMKKIINFKEIAGYSFFLNYNSKKEIVMRKKIFFFKNNLSYKDYLRLLKRSNFVLLPYTHKVYEYNISGIFTDCVLMNKIPIVHKDMLCAKLLKKNKLKILLYNFYDHKNFYSKIKLINNRRKEIQKNMIIFKKKYLDYFSNPAVFWENIFN